MKRKISLIFALLAAVLVFTVCISAAETFVNPVVNGADPFVFKDTDGTYYLYVTSGGSYGYRVYSSTNLVEWEARGYCLRRADVYTDDAIVSETSGNKVYNFWAPEIIKEGDTYYMVYTAQEHIGIATSDSPLGPFTNDADSYLLPDFKNIDGHFFKDDDGKLYLYFVSAGKVNYNGYSVSNGNNIWGGEFDLETCSFVSAPKLLVKYDTALDYILTGGTIVRDPVAEGPEILKHNGKYYLTYSASGYTDPAYAVHYATSDSPLGSFAKYPYNPILKSDDADRNDVANPHLYGTAHHCFTTSPDGSELIIVYHAHRTGLQGYTNSAGEYEYVEERRICIDRAWFDESGVLHAGSLEDGVPTATAQPLPSGGKLTRTEPVLAGTPFEALETLPTIYLSNKDGNDANNGLTAETALKSMDAAYAALPNGGTIILTQTYQLTNGVNSGFYTAPAVNGPIMIKGAFSAVPLAFKFYRVQSDTYFDNLVLLPQTESSIAVIECNNNNVTFGEGVSCHAQPTRKTFAYLIGGKWWSTSTSDAYNEFNQYKSNSEVTSDKAYTINVLGGSWTAIYGGSMKSTTLLSNTAPNATLNIAEDVIIRPAKASAPTVAIASEGATLTFKAVEHAKKYAIYKNGDLVGYSDTTSYVDTAYVSGEDATYAVAGYVHGACIGDVSSSTAFTWSGDKDGDGIFSLADALKMIRDMLSGESGETLIDLLILLKQLAK